MSSLINLTVPSGSLRPCVALRAWQREAARQLTERPNLLLGAQPGAGKTITTLTALVHSPKRSLLVAPEVILDTVWAQEAARWQHTRTLTFLWHTASLRTNAWPCGFQAQAIL